MNKLSKRIICILMICMFIVMNCTIGNIYAATEKEELIEVLDGYREDIGDINEFRNVIDKIYRDLNSATEVNDELKQQLKDDIDELANVPDIHPVILQVLDVELKSQTENLNDSNKEEMEEEIAIIKEWAENNSDDSDEDEYIDEGEYGDYDEDDDSEFEDESSIEGKDSSKNYSSMILPRAGKIGTIIISVIFIILIANAIISKIKYGQFKGIK